MYNYENDNYPSLIVCNNWRSPVVSQGTLTTETGRNSLFPARYIEEGNFSSHPTSWHWRAAEWCSLCTVLVRAGLPTISAGNCLTFNNQHITLINIIKLCFNALCFRFRLLQFEHLFCHLKIALKCYDWSEVICPCKIHYPS